MKNWLLERLISSCFGVLCLRYPNKQTTNRMFSIERVHQPTNLISVPDVATLEFRQSHRAKVYLVKNCFDLHR